VIHTERPGRSGLLISQHVHSEPSVEGAAYYTQYQPEKAVILKKFLPASDRSFQSWAQKRAGPFCTNHRCAKPVPALLIYSLFPKFNSRWQTYGDFWYFPISNYSLLGCYSIFLSKRTPRFRRNPLPLFSHSRYHKIY